MRKDCNVVYFIACHHKLDQVYRFADVILRGSPTAEVVIHYDGPGEDVQVGQLAGGDRLQVLPFRVPVSWGDFSTVQMTIRGLEWITRNYNFQWVHFLSGQDYPVKPIASMESTLDASEYDVFMSGVSLDSKQPCGPNECSLEDGSSSECSDCHSRYRYQFRKVNPETNRMIRIMVRKIERYQSDRSFLQVRQVGPDQRKLLGYRSLRSPFNSQRLCYKGSQWWSMRQDVVNFTLRYIQKHPVLARHYKQTILSDESFFQTIVFNGSGFKICRENKRFIPWHRSKDDSPQLVSMRDLEEISKSDYFFARKFDPSLSSAVLDRIDSLLLANHD